jgi:hypothetical protein
VNEELRSRLCDVFLEAGAAVVRRMQEVGFPLTLPVHRPAVWRTDNGVGIAPHLYNVNILFDQISLFRAAPLMGMAEIATIFECAEQIAHLIHDNPLISESPVGRGSLLIDPSDQADNITVRYDEGAPEWVARALILPALEWHLGKLPSVEQADRGAAESFARSVIDVASDNLLRFCVDVPLAGIDVGNSGELAEDDVTLRRLSESEQSEWLEEVQYWLAPMITPPDVVLEIRSSYRSREEKSGSTASLAYPLLTAFQLHGYAIAGGYIRDRSDPTWLGPRIGTTIQLARAGFGALPLDSDNLRKIMETRKQIAHHGEGISPKSMAIRRFSSGVARAEIEDGLVDFTVALEALLLPYDEETRRGELGYRFRMHGAHYLAGDVAERSQVAKQLTKIYGVRSGLVHGGNYPGFAEVVEAYNSARNFAARGLLRALREGFPTPEVFKRMLLGIPPSLS